MSIRFPGAQTARAACLTLALTGLSLAAGCGQEVAVATGAAQAGQAHASAHTRAPGWVEGSVVYGVVPPFLGHDPLKDTTAKLGYLKGQGVDALWLSPVYATDDPSAISYAVTDYKKVREDFGTQADFKRMVDEAHRHGLKVLMDFVPNHTSTGHSHYQDALKRGPKSPYYNHYVRDAKGTPQFYFDWTNLINLNFDQAPVRQMMTDAFTYWVKDMGVDGFRVDAAWGIKDRTPDYWPELNRTLRAHKPDLFMLAEASARDPYYVNNGFDAAYDWGKELGHWAWEGVFEDKAHAGAKLHTALGGKETPPERVARFLNNNDTGERFITRYGVETQRVAAVLLHTLPGIPVVYMGDEIGAEFEPYEDPEPLAWTDKHKLQPLYKRLAELRETMPALRSGKWTPIKTAKTPGVYAFVRDAGSKDWAVVVLNFGAAATAELKLPAKFASQAASGKLTDALTGRAAPVETGEGGWAIAMKKSSAFVLTPTSTR
jgi:glycosidase